MDRKKCFADLQSKSYTIWKDAQKWPRWKIEKHSRSKIKSRDINPGLFSSQEEVTEIYVVF